MFDTFDFMAFNWCCILGVLYYHTFKFTLNLSIFSAEGPYHAR